MKKPFFFAKIKHIFSSACVFFTLAEFLLLAIVTVIEQTDPSAGGEAVRYLSLSSAALIFVGCLLLASLNQIFSTELSMPVKLCFHFLGTLVAFFLLFVVIPGVLSNPGAVIARLGLFTGAYFVIALIVLIVNSIRKNKKSAELEYESQFSSRH